MDSLLIPVRLYFSLLFQAEVIDVSYGNADNLKRIQKMKNTTNQIALLKLGKLPLLYKVGPMAVCWWWADFFFFFFGLHASVSGKKERPRRREKEKHKKSECHRK